MSQNIGRKPVFWRDYYISKKQTNKKTLPRGNGERMVRRRKEREIKVKEMNEGSRNEAQQANSEIEKITWKSQRGLR